MSDFRNLKSLEMYLKKVIVDSMDDVGKSAEYHVRDKIEEEVYRNPITPQVYERTRELKNSLVHTHPIVNNNEIITEIKHETDLIGNYEPNQHMSVVTGEPFIEPLAEIVNYGKAGHIFGTGYWTEPRPYINDSKKDLENGLIKKYFKDALSKKGIKIQ
jgi:hypothetical protein